MSAVWEFFSISEKDRRFAICKTCSIEVSRGGNTTKDFNTTNLRAHLQSRHAAEYNDFLKADKKRLDALAAKKLKSASTSQTPSVATAFEKVKPLPADSARAKGGTKKIMEMIALDDEPFTVVEKRGFRGVLKYFEPRYKLPSRRHMAEVCLPELYHVVAGHIHDLLAGDIPAISFTTDIWSSDVSPVSMISLTAQWIDTEFNLVKTVLHSQEFTGSHTAQMIAGCFENMFETWKIPKTKVHTVVRDNARNMAKAMRDLNLPSFGCMAHSLQLAVNDGVLTQPSVDKAVTICRKIVGHFKHSVLAYSELEKIQIKAGEKVKRLQQDVQTRWNSTYLMMQSLVEQKHALAAYGVDHDLPEKAKLTSQQWQLIENMITLLAPFEQLTRDISASEASAADVIPSVIALKRLLSKAVDTDQGVKTTKAKLLESVDKRFTECQYNPLFLIATLLDPRYKDLFFTDEDVKQRARAALEAQLEGSQGGTATASAARGSPDNDDPTTSDHPLHKRARTEEEQRERPRLHDMFQEILQEKGPDVPR